MPEFLEIMEYIRAEDAMASRSEGRRAGGNRSVQFLEARNGLAKLMADVATGKRPATRLREAMSTSDFPLLFGDILDKSMLGRYTLWPSTWPAIGRRRTVRDFRDVRVSDRLTGLESAMSQVAELEEAEYGPLAEGTPITYSVAKYERKAALSWEAWINDDMDQLKDIPERFALGARRTEDSFVANLWLDSAGPHASLFTAGNANIINTTNGAAVNNPPLDIEGLQDAFTVLAAQTDSEGNPIMIDMVTLVVPPALEIVARNLLNATELRINDAGGVTNQQMIVANWMRNRVTLVVDPYIPQIVTTGTVGQTMWALFANPNNGRAALDVAFLRGYEQPQIYVKTPNMTRVGAGAQNAFEGDFERDAIEYKARHVVGGARIDGKMAVASKGTSA